MSAPKLIASNLMVACLDGFTAVVSAAVPLGMYPPSDLEGQRSRAATVVACTLLLYASLSMLNGARVYPHLLSKSTFVTPRTGLMVIPLVWSADSTVASSLFDRSLLVEGGWRALATVYCVTMAVCLTYRRIS